MKNNNEYRAKLRLLKKELHDRSITFDQYVVKKGILKRRYLEGIKC